MGTPTYRWDTELPDGQRPGWRNGLPPDPEAVRAAQWIIERVPAHPLGEGATLGQLRALLPEPLTDEQLRAAVAMTGRPEPKRITDRTAFPVYPFAWRYLLAHHGRTPLKVWSQVASWHRCPAPGDPVILAGRARYAAAPLRVHRAAQWLCDQVPIVGWAAPQPGSPGADTVRSALCAGTGEFFNNAELRAAADALEVAHLGSGPTLRFALPIPVLALLASRPRPAPPEEPAVLHTDTGGSP